MAKKVTKLIDPLAVNASEEYKETANKNGLTNIVIATGPNLNIEIPALLDKENRVVFPVKE